jgi:CRP/FNR family transcriptional regulator
MATRELSAATNGMTFAGGSIAQTRPSKNNPISNCVNCHQRNRCPLSPIDKISQIIERLPLREAVYEPGATVATENQKIDKILVVKSGSVQLSSLNTAGVQQTHGFAFPNSILAPESIETGNLYLTMTTLEKTRICAIDRTELLYALRLDSDFFHLYLKAIAQQVEAEKIYTMKLRRGTVETRTSAFILHLYDTYNPARGMSNDIILSMSRSSISSYLDITSESLSRCLSSLSKHKIISVFNRRITILNIDGLKKLANS